MVFTTQFTAINKVNAEPVTLTILGGIALYKILIGAGVIAAGAMTGYVISEEIQKNERMKAHYNEIEESVRAVKDYGAKTWEFSDELIDDVKTTLNEVYDVGSNAVSYATNIPMAYYRAAFRPSLITKAFTYYYNDHSFYIELFGEVGTNLCSSKTSTYAFESGLSAVNRVSGKNINDNGWIKASRVSYIPNSPSNTIMEYYSVSPLSQRAIQHYNYYYPNDDISLENNIDCNLSFNKLKSININGIENIVKIAVVDGYKYKVFEDTIGDGTVTPQNTIYSGQLPNSVYGFEGVPEFNVYEDGRILVYALYKMNAASYKKSAHTKELSNAIKTYTQESTAVVVATEEVVNDTIIYNPPVSVPNVITLPAITDTYDDVIDLTYDDVIGDDGQVDNPPDTDTGLFTGIWKWLQSFWAKLGELINSLGIKSALQSISAFLSGIREDVSAIAYENIEQSNNFDENSNRYSLPLLFALLFDILLACIMLILRFIVWLVTMPSIPATNVLLDPGISTAYDFMRNQNIPIFNISLITLVSIVLTFCFGLIIARKVKGVNSV